MGWITAKTNMEMVPGMSYFADNAAQTLSFSLPLLPDDGDTLTIYGIGLWQIVQAPDQQMRIWGQTTTLGPSGSIYSSSRSDTITLVYCASSSIWETVEWQGNLNFQ